MRHAGLVRHGRARRVAQRATTHETTPDDVSQLSTDQAPGDKPETVNCLAGLDEAGLGPILGPLVIAGSAFSGPRGVDPWDALDGIAVRARPRAGQILVADSKKVKSGARGFERLERTVLTFWAAWRGEIPATVGAFLGELGVDPTTLSSCPWYRDVTAPLPRDNDRRALELAGHLLRQRLDAAGMSILDLRVRPVEVAEFNRWIADTDNKSTSHFRGYSEVLFGMLGVTPAGTHVVADRCGGRSHYRHGLLAAGARRVVVDRETPSASTYRVDAGRGTVRVSFVSGGEERAFPTALASCMAKYVRELYIERLNDWFTKRVPDLRPTAGYYVDGHRFLDDTEAFIAGEGLPRHRLVRVR